MSQKIAENLQKSFRENRENGRFSSEKGIREIIRKFLKNILTLAPILIGSFSTPKRGRRCSSKLQQPAATLIAA
jgi:hypothetical protein